VRRRTRIDRAPKPRVARRTALAIGMAVPADGKPEDLVGVTEAGRGMAPGVELAGREGDGLVLCSMGGVGLSEGGAEHLSWLRAILPATGVASGHGVSDGELLTAASPVCIVIVAPVLPTESSISGPPRIRSV
jgi:hypothetical protein